MKNYLIIVLSILCTILTSCSTDDLAAFNNAMGQFNQQQAQLHNELAQLPAAGNGQATYPGTTTTYQQPITPAPTSQPYTQTSSNQDNGCWNASGCVSMSGSGSSSPASYIIHNNCSGRVYVRTIDAMNSTTSSQKVVHIGSGGGLPANSSAPVFGYVIGYSVASVWYQWVGSNNPDNDSTCAYNSGNWDSQATNEENQLASQGYNLGQ